MCIPAHFTLNTEKYIAFELVIIWLHKFILSCRYFSVMHQHRSGRDLYPTNTNCRLNDKHTHTTFEAYSSAVARKESLSGVMVAVPRTFCNYMLPERRRIGRKNVRRRESWFVSGCGKYLPALAEQFCLALRRPCLTRFINLSPCRLGKRASASRYTS